LIHNKKTELKSHQFNLKYLSDTNYLAMQMLLAQSDRLMLDELAKKERALIQKGQSEVEAQKRKQLAIILAEEEAAVMKYKAETELINSKIQGQKEVTLITLKTEGETQAQKN